MKSVLFCLLAGMIGSSTALAQHSAALLGAYQDASDVDAGFGILARYQHDFQPEASGLRAFVQAGQYMGFDGEERASYMDASASMKLDMNLTAIEAALLYDFVNESGWTPYAGLGVGYYLPDIDYEFNASIAEGYGADLVGDGRADADNEFGFFALGGVEKKLGEHLSVFAEARYTLLEVTVNVTDSATATTRAMDITHSAQNRYSVDADLGGIGAAIGASYLW